MENKWDELAKGISRQSAEGAIWLLLTVTREQEKRWAKQELFSFPAKFKGNINDKGLSELENKTCFSLYL